MVTSGGEVLLEQLRECKEQFDIDVTFRSSEDIEDIEEDAIVFYDEYYHDLLHTKLTTDKESGTATGMLGFRF